MSKITILALVCFQILNVSFAVADEKKENPEWFVCSKDSDCVDINYSCAGAVVNRKFAEEANSHYRYINSVSECFMKPTEKNPKTPPFKVFCKQKKCQKQGMNPKIGFS